MNINKNELFKVIDPFCRVALINKKLPKEFRDKNENSETPLRDVLPGIWPTIGDLEKLFEFGERLGWKSSFCSDK